MGFRLLADAIPFCYGPASALSTFFGALLSLSPYVEVDVLCSGSTAELLNRSALPFRLLSVDSEDARALASVPFASYDAFVDVCNPVSFGFAKAAAAPTVYLDFLLWMHDGPRDETFDADLY